ncbi:MarC family protein [Xenococcus sp. PCC 7305]|uniref:MarC family protein n=1 Tax=Xenococcus sp. PCC 7305 TaxID=102125 RepID=UPI00193099C4|nr:MarC family protein [Xenococcus sp. PCC 7305]
MISQIAESNDLESEKTDLTNIIEHQIRFIKDIRKIYGKNSLSRLAIIFLMTIGPIKIIPVFVKLTQNASKKVKRKLAIRSFTLSTSVIFVIALSSQNILNKYNISLSSLIGAAGIVLFLVSIRMLLAQYETNVTNSIKTPDNPLTTLISPLTFPTILTPQGIALVMISMTIAKRLDNNVDKILGLIAIIMILNLLCMLYADKILSFIRPALLLVLSSMLTIIQLALAISFIFSAINLQVLTIYYIIQKQLLSLPIL